MKTTNGSSLSEKNFAALAAAMKAVMDGERKKKQEMPNQEIRQALKEKRLRLYDLAKATGYAESTISNKLRNELEPHEAQMYLSVIRKMEAKTVRRSRQKPEPDIKEAWKRDTLCFHCNNFKCSWRQRLVPVKGWEAVRTVRANPEGQYIQSFAVIDCPQYERKGKYANDEEWKAVENERCKKRSERR